MLKIGIVTALTEESSLLKQCFGNCVKVHEDGVYKVYEYNYFGKSIYLINSGVGEIAGALASQYLILSLGAECILNVGVVGSLNKKYKRGQLVVVKEIVHYDFTAKYSDDSVAGIYIGKDSFDMRADERLPQKFMHFATLPQVRIASADKFVDDKELKYRLVDKFGCDICDMESCGIYFACENNKVPYLLVKCISDNADENAEESFEQAISGGVEHYVEYISEFIKTL